MKIDYSKKFNKHYKSRIKPNLKLSQRFRERVELFFEDKDNPILHDHKLIGTLQSFRAFSITSDIRVAYVLVGSDKALFFDIGTHNQVYS